MAGIYRRDVYGTGMSLSIPFFVLVLITSQERLRGLSSIEGQDVDIRWRAGADAGGTVCAGGHLVYGKPSLSFIRV